MTLSLLELLIAAKKKNNSRWEGPYLNVLFLLVKLFGNSEDRVK